MAEPSEDFAEQSGEFAEHSEDFVEPKEDLPGDSNLEAGLDRHSGEASSISQSSIDATTNEKRQPTMRLAWIALVLGFMVAAIAQYLAPSFDHQNANLIALAAIAMAGLYFLFSLHRVDRWGGHPTRIPVGMLGLVVAFVIFFEPQGFNGEMLPRFRYRFSKEVVREIKSVTEQPSELLSDGAAADQAAGLGKRGNNAKDGAEAESGETRPTQFLGPARNGVYFKRAFEVPSKKDEVKVVWDHGIGAAWSSFAIVGGLAVTLEQRDDQECLTCYQLLDGNLRWLKEHQGLHQNPLGGIGPRSTPTISGGDVYATTATGFLWCVDLDSGRVKWSQNLLEIAGWDQAAFESAAPWGYASSPLIVDGLCVTALGGPLDSDSSASLVAFDALSGELRWKSGEDQLSYASPVLMTLDGQRQIVSVNEKTVTGHAITDGKLLWEFSWPGSSNTGANCSSAVPVGADRVLVGKGYGGGSAVVRVSREGSEWTTEDVWRSHRVLKTKFNHACVQGDVGYGISNGSLQAVNLEDATPYWNQPRRKRAAQGQVVLVEDVLVLQDEEGDLVFVEASVDDYNELLRLPALDSKTWNIPTVYGRYVLVRNDRQAICFELPARTETGP